MRCLDIIFIDIQNRQYCCLSRISHRQTMAGLMTLGSFGTLFDRTDAVKPESRFIKTHDIAGDIDIGIWFIVYQIEDDILVF